MAFKEQFRSVDVLMIDDVQFISGKDSTQEEFFHTFNALVDQNRQVISADKSPSDLEGMEERLRSRLGWGLVADIHPTTYELRLGILQAKAESMNVQINSKVLEFLAHKITSNVRELEGALNRIVAHAELVGRAITLESTQEVLHDLLQANDRRVTIDEIQKKVAEHYNIRLADMHSARRARAGPATSGRHVPRQAAYRPLLPEIGRNSAAATTRRSCTRSRRWRSCVRPTRASPRMSNCFAACLRADIRLFSIAGLKFRPRDGIG